MMMMMTTNPEYLATEDLAIAKSSVAISSAHHDDVNDDDDANVDVNDEEEEEATQALSRQVASSLKKSQNLKSISSSESWVINRDCHPTQVQSAGAYFLVGAKTQGYLFFWSQKVMGGILHTLSFNACFKFVQRKES